jgi:hypothetical protein
MDIKVFDWQGQQRDLAYLKGKYGNFIIQPAAAGEGSAFYITVLREKVNTAATVVVRVTDANGVPLQDIRIAWYWPDAPADPNAGPMGSVPPQMRPNRCVNGMSNPDGDVGFGMGHGAYYFPNQGQIGPHAAWIYGTNTRSDLILGLGMVGGTNHDHFDVEYARLESEPPPPPPGECPKEEILAEMSKIEADLAKIQDAVAAIQKSTQAVRQLLENV